jgi:DNA polymerase-3 subunit chi
LAATPIWLAPGLPAGAGHQVLLNMGAAVPEDLGRVERLLELVGTDAADAQAGRQRWRQYQTRGFEIQPYDRKGRD